MNKLKLVLSIACFALIFAGIFYLLKPSAESKKEGSDQHTLNNFNESSSSPKDPIPIQAVTENTSKSVEDRIDTQSTQDALPQEKLKPSTQLTMSASENSESQGTKDQYAKEGKLRDVLYKIMEDHPNITIDKVNCEVEKCELKYSSYDQFNTEVTNKVLKEYIDIYGESVQLKNVLESSGTSSVEIIIRN